MDAERERRKEGRVAILLIVAPLAFLALMAWVIWGDFEAAERSRRSLTWPSVPGVIVSSSYEPSRGGKVMRSCRAWFRYRYEVGGHALVNGTSRLGSSCRALEDEVASYPPGREVLVYYDPDDPSDTVLNPHEHGVSWGMDIFIGVLSVVAAVPFILTGLALRNWLPLPRVSRQVARAEERERVKKKNAARRKRRRTLGG